MILVKPSEACGAIITALILGIIVFSALVFPFSYMGFDSDCFGLVFFCSIRDGFWDHLTHLGKSIQTSYVSLNDLAEHQEGLLTYYRPFMTLFHYLCFNLFGTSSKAYFFCNVGFHAISSSFLFVLYSFFMTPPLAVVLTLFFAFHPALITSYVGVTSHVVPTYVFFFGMLLAYRSFLISNQIFWYFLSVFLFLGSLLCYEIVIVFPLVLVLYFFMFDSKKIVHKTYLFFVVLFGYSLVRMSLLGRVSSNESLLFSPVSFVARAIGNWHQAIKPFWGMQDFSKFLPASLTFLVVVLIASYFFMQPRARKKIFFLGVSFFAFAWPVTIVTGDGRYFYLAIPCLGLILVDALAWLQKKLSVPVVIPLMSMLIFWGFMHAHQALAQRRDLTCKRDQSFCQLVKKYHKIQDLNLVMLGTLHCFKGETLLMQQGMTQAARLFFDNKDLQAFHVTQAKIFLTKQPDKSFIIEPVKRGFRFISPDPENLFFMIPHGWREGEVIPFSMGSIYIHKKSASWKAYDVSFIFSVAWLTQLKKGLAVFVTFDPANWTFLTLDSSHLVERKACE